MIPLARFSAILLFTSLVHAGDQSAADAGLPQPFDAGFADELLTHSPFTRIVNLEDSIQLTGIAYVEGRPVATFLNKTTQQQVTVSDEPNPQGWKITEAIPGTELQDTEVRLMIGTEEITMHYGDAQLSPGGAKKGVPTSHVAGSGSGPDSRPNSRGDDHIRTSSFLGENGRELYASLSSEARGKLKDAVREYVQKHPEQSVEQNSAYAQKVFSKLKAADQKSGGNSSAKSPKSDKKIKNK